MKKIVLVLFLAFSLLLSACGSAPAAPVQTAAPVPTESVPTPEATPEPTPEPKPTVIEGLCYEGEYSDGVGNNYHYRFALPVVTGQSDDIERLNADLYAAFAPDIEESLQAIKTGYSLITYYIGYQVWENGDVLSVLVKEDNDWGMTRYYAMNLQLSDKTEATRAELLALYGLSEEDFRARASEAAGAFFREMYKNLPEENYAEYNGDELLTKTVDPANFGSELSLWIDAAGRLCMAAPVYSFAGAEYYYYVISVA